MRVLRWCLVLGGAALIGYGISGLLSDRFITDPLGVLWWLLGGLVLHDGLWVPLVCLAGAYFARSTPLRSGLIVAAAVTAIALPVVLRQGTNHGNSSLLPLPYLRNLLWLLAGIAVLTLLWEVQSRHLPGRATAALRGAEQRRRDRRAERKARRASTRR